MLPKWILWFNILICLSIHKFQLIYVEGYWILYLILQISVLFLLYPHPIMSPMFFYSKSNHYIYIEFSFEQFNFQSSLHNLEILVLLSCLISLMKVLVETIFGGNNDQSKVIVWFLFWKVIAVKKNKTKMINFRQVGSTYCGSHLTVSWVRN